MELSDLLQWAHDRAKTGALVFDNSRTEKRVFFENGRVVASASSDPKEYLSNFVLAYGLVPEQRLALVLERIEGSDQLLGRTLVTQGDATRDALAEILRIKTKETVFDRFDWPAGEFRFVDDERLTGELTELQLEVAELVTEGRRRKERLSYLRRFVPHTRAIPVAIGFLDDPSLQNHERTVLKLVDDQRTVHDISMMSRTTEFHVCEILVSRIEKGRLKVIVPHENDGQREISKGGMSTGISILDSDSLLQAALRHYDSGNYEKTLRYLKAARSLEPDNQKVKAQIQEAESKVAELLDQAGIIWVMVPVLNRTIAELSRLRLSPEAGFLLTRIDGSYDLGAIMKITPMPPLEARLLVFRLLEQEHIRLQPREVVRG